MIQKWFLKIGSLLITFLFCAQFSSQNLSTTGKEKPSTNVYGILTDSNNQSYTIDNITIAGRFSDIAVYQKPTTPDINPDIDKTLIDLCAIREIRVEAPKIVQFNKRDYIEIVVISNDQNPTQNRYIIERSKKLFCDQGSLEKELSFIAIKRLQIQGCKKQEEKPRNCPASNQQRQEAPQPMPIQKSKEELDSTITKTQSLINELEQRAEKLTSEQDTTLKSQILQIIQDLKVSIHDTFKNWFA